MKRSLTFSLLALVSALLSGACSRNVRWFDELDRSMPLMQRAHAKEGEGDRAAAIELYRRALDADPRLAAAHLDLALLLHDYAGDYVGAIHHYRRYLELRPKTEKREMIEERIRLASQVFAASIMGPATGETAKQQIPGRGSQPDRSTNSVSTADLVKENTDLRDKVKALEAETARLRQQIAGDRTAQAHAGLQEPGAGASPQKAGRTYQVQPGDSLSSIAQKTYGDRRRWEQIYRANKSALDASYRLKVGQVLVIP